MLPPGTPGSVKSAQQAAVSTRRVLLALRPTSPVDRLFKIATGLCRRMGADLEVLADPARPDWAALVTRIAAMERDGVTVYLTAMPGLAAGQVVEYARRHECIATVIVGRPAAWASGAADPWARLECPLVAAADHPDLPQEQ